MQEIDEGPHKGLTLCADEGIYGLKLMQTLPQNLQQNAQIYSEMYSDKMPPGRWNPYDQVILRYIIQNIQPYQNDIPLIINIETPGWRIPRQPHNPI